MLQPTAPIGQYDNAGEYSASTNLLVMAKTRDNGAWSRLIRLFGPAVYKWLDEHGLRGDDANELAQRVFVVP